MGDLAIRVAALSPEKLELLERWLALRRVKTEQAQPALTAERIAAESVETLQAADDSPAEDAADAQGGMTAGVGVDLEDGNLAPGEPAQATSEPHRQSQGGHDKGVSGESRDSIAQTQQEAAQLLAALEDLPDDTVDSLLRQILGEQVDASPPVAEEPPRTRSDSLDKTTRPPDSAEELLENLNQFSEHDVDSLLAQLLAGEGD